jgi:glutamine amidotransferase
MTKRIVIVDYGLGNVYSVKRALEVSGAEEVVISSDPLTVYQADGLVLPGVGAFSEGMIGLQSRHLIEPIINYSKTGRPLLGICLGMQMLASMSEEFGNHTGLDLIPGNVIPIPTKSADGQTLKIPYIGWSVIKPSREDAYTGSVLQVHGSGEAVYLLHSFHVCPAKTEYLLATYIYGGHPITAAIRHRNVTGLQFHPERSGPVGLRIIKQFVKNA